MGNAGHTKILNVVFAVKFNECLEVPLQLFEWFVTHVSQCEHLITSKIIIIIFNIEKSFNGLCLL